MAKENVSLIFFYENNNNYLNNPDANFVYFIYYLCVACGL